MTKKTFRWLWKNSLLSLLVAVLLLPFACRTEKDLSENEQQSEYFQVFSKQSIYSKNENQLDYAKGFAFLAQRYDSLHSTNISGLVNSNNQTNWDEKLQQKFIEKSNDAYVEFRIHSQTIEDDNGDKWVVYPRIQNQQVKELVLAVLSENETLVYFYNIDTYTPFHKTNAPLFQERYNEHFLTDDKSKIQLVFENSKCGFPGYPACEIQGVIITQGGSGSGNAWGLLDGGSGEGEGGDCNGFDACIETDDSGGGGSSTLPYVYISPCQKAKAMMNGELFKNNIEILENKTGLSYEVGYRINHPNENAGETEPQNQVLENKSGTDYINLNYNLPNTYIVMHSHYNGLYPIFSPKDVKFFNEWLVAAQNYNQNVSDSEKMDLKNLYLVVVTSAGNYTLAFDGDAVSALPNYTDEQMEALTSDYAKNYMNEAVSVGNYSGETNIDQEKLEEQFLKFFSEKMNFSGLKMYDLGIDNDGTLTEITLDSDGDRDTQDCE